MIPEQAAGDAQEPRAGMMGSQIRSAADLCLPVKNDPQQNLAKTVGTHFLPLSAGPTISQLKDTVHDEEAKVPKQQDGQDKRGAAQNIPRGFLLPYAPAAPGEDTEGKDVF